MQTLYKTVYRPNKKIKTKYGYNCNIDWIAGARLCLITQNIHFNRIERKLGYKFVCIFHTCNSVDQYFQILPVSNHFWPIFHSVVWETELNFFLSYTRRLQVKNCPTKIRYKFLKNSVYFKNRFIRYLIQKTPKGPDFVAW